MEAGEQRNIALIFFGRALWGRRMPRLYLMFLGVRAGVRAVLGWWGWKLKHGGPTTLRRLSIFPVLSERVKERERESVCVCERDIERVVCKIERYRESCV